MDRGARFRASHLALRVGIARGGGARPGRLSPASGRGPDSDREARQDADRAPAGARSRGDRALSGALSLSAGEGPAAVPGRAGRTKSEEHTSELQSLMRISYPVFCLKKK